MNFAWVEPARARWNALGARERRVASALAVFFGAVLFYLLVWTPVEGGLARARSRLVSVQAQLARVQEQAARAASLRAAPRVTLPANPAAAVGQAAERQGLREGLKRTDAEGLAGNVTRGAARTLATRAACSCTRASCAWTEARRERAFARPLSTGVQTSR